PAQNAFLTTQTPTLTWAPSSDIVGVDHYVVTLDGVPRTPSVPASTTPSYTPTVSAGGHAWTVQAFDAAGNPSGPSASRSFSVGAVPVAPIVTGPPALSNDATPTFSWTGEPGASFTWRVLNQAGNRVRPTV